MKDSSLVLAGTQKLPTTNIRCTSNRQRDMIRLSQLDDAALALRVNMPARVIRRLRAKGQKT